MKRTRRLLPLGLAIVLAGLAGASAQAQSRLASLPFAKSLDGKLSARFAGPSCGETVDFVISGDNVATFNKDHVASRLMNNIVQTVLATCPKVKMFSAKGVVGDQIAYNAIAESATGWMLLELGASRDASLIGGGQRGGSADKGAFARRGDFVGFADLPGKLGGKPFLCTSWDGSTCTAVIELRGANRNGSNLVARSLLDGAGAQAVLSYAGVNRNGFLCSNPEEARIEVIGGQATDMARARMAKDLRERLKPYGQEMCLGFAQRGANIINGTFDATGARIGNESLLNPMTTLARLRKEK